MSFDYNDQNYDRYCTARQLQMINGLREGKSQRALAKELGISKSTITSALSEVSNKALKSGYNPENGMTEPFDPSLVHQKSTVHVKDGQVVQYWARLSPDEEKRQAFLKEAAKTLTDSLPKYKPIKAPKRIKSDLANCFVITDFHLGMLAHKEETHDADWDLKTGEQILVQWFQRAIELAPPAKVAVFAQMGDFLHWDGLDAVTPASKHILDADTRFHKLVRAAIRVIRKVFDMLLEKYERVEGFMIDANHDPASEVWLRELFHAVYENEKRINIDLNPNPYCCYEFGKVALFFHHGHKRKVANVDSVFAGLYRDVYGRTNHAYAHLGHLHSVEVKESNLMIVEQHRTLAPADAYAARGGWLSGRDAKVITYHKEYGEVSRLTISPEMLK